MKALIYIVLLVSLILTTGCRKVLEIAGEEVRHVLEIIAADRVVHWWNDKPSPTPTPTPPERARRDKPSLAVAPPEPTYTFRSSRLVNPDTDPLGLHVGKEDKYPIINPLMLPKVEKPIGALPPDVLDPLGLHIGKEDKYPIFINPLRLPKVEKPIGALPPGVLDLGGTRWTHVGVGTTVNEPTSATHSIDFLATFKEDGSLEVELISATPFSAPYDRQRSTGSGFWKQKKDDVIFNWKVDSYQSKGTTYTLKIKGTTMEGVFLNVDTCDWGNCTWTRFNAVQSSDRSP